MVTSVDPVQYRRHVEERRWRPTVAVWELTLACNLRCIHCGSIAGKPRVEELGTDRCLGIMDELADLGCGLVTLSGGEPTLRSDWDAIARRGVDRGMQVNMVTNGVYRGGAGPLDIARRALAAGMCNAGVSIDGDRDVHETIRGSGTFDETVASVRAFVDAGFPVTIMTTVTSLNLPILDDIRRHARDLGASAWRLQLGKPMGSLGDRRRLTITPDEYHALIPRIARWQRDTSFPVGVGDSIGYYGPYEETIRNTPWRGRALRWQGCQAGMLAIGIEADGEVKGCLSLQSRIDGVDPFREGSLRDASLEEIWYRPGSFAYNRDFDEASLTGECASCSHASECRGGATCVAAAFTGTTTEDPFCWHRVEELERGARASAVKHAAALAASAAMAVLASSSVMADTTEVAREDGTTTSTHYTMTSSGDNGDQAVEGTGPKPEYGVPGPYYDTEYAVGPPYDEPPVTEEYGIEPPPDPSVGEDYGVDPPPDPPVLEEYGVMPPPDPIVTEDYGVEPPPLPPPSVKPAYGVEKPVHLAPGPGTTPPSEGSTPPDPPPKQLDYGVESPSPLEPPNYSPVQPDYGIDPMEE